MIHYFWSIVKAIRHNGDIVFIIADDNLDESNLKKDQLTKIVVVEHEGKLWLRTITKFTLLVFKTNKNNVWKRI